MQATAVRPGSNSWPLVVCAGLAVFMAQLDTTVVTVALPAIRSDLRTSAGAVEWVVLGYVVPLIGLSLFWGRWLDHANRRRTAAVSIAGFAVCSLAVAGAPGLIAVVAARALQGAFASALLALAPAVAVDAVAARSRGRALGLVSTLAPLGAMLGPAVGGQLIDLAGWRPIFLLNIPVAAAVVVLARCRLHDDRRFVPPERPWLGEAALLGTAAALALGGLSLAASHGLPWLALVLAAAVPVALWLRTGAGREVRLLVGEPGLWAPHLALLTAYAAVLATMFLIPFFLEHTLRLPAGAAGLVLLAYPAATAAISPVSGALSDRVGPRPPAVAGAGVLTVGVALLVPLSSGWSPTALAWRLAVIGIGFGLCVTAAQSVAMAHAAPDRRGLASATTNVARQAGLAFGPALATLAWGLQDYGTAGMTTALAGAAAMAAVTVAAVATFGSGGSARSQTSSFPVIPPGSERSTTPCP